MSQSASPYFGVSILAKTMGKHVVALKLFSKMACKRDKGIVLQRLALQAVFVLRVIKGLFITEQLAIYHLLINSCFNLMRNIIFKFYVVSDK